MYLSVYYTQKNQLYLNNKNFVLYDGGLVYTKKM